MIREANIDDIESICIICEQPGLQSYNKDGNYKEWFMELFNSETTVALVYESDNKILGAVVGENISCGGNLIWMLGVIPEKHGSIIAPQLLNHYENECMKLGVTWIYCEGYVETINPNKMAKIGYLTNDKIYRTYVKNLLINGKIT